ncbi:MAG TPA: hypothetical protein VM012_10070, partial [Flavitalea sp.]|nr:hypothetical protein [Flavitalea sp.]
MSSCAIAKDLVLLHKEIRKTSHFKSVSRKDAKEAKQQRKQSRTRKEKISFAPFVFFFASLREIFFVICV